MSLSDRVRPNSEAAPWVVEEIKKLEAELERTKFSLSVAMVTDDERAKYKELGKECYNEAYMYELEYPSTKWSTLLFKVGKALGGDK